MKKTALTKAEKKAIMDKHPTVTAAEAFTANVGYALRSERSYA
jgi:hypothetical protein